MQLWAMTKYQHPKAKLSLSGVTLMSCVPLVANLSQVNDHGLNNINIIKLSGSEYTCKSKF